MSDCAINLDRWLGERLSMIGASESPALFYEGYKNESPYTLYKRKIGELPSQSDEENEALEWGREIQPVVLKMFTKRTGIEVEDLGPFTIQRHPNLPFIGATLDGLAYVDGRKAVVEAKNVGQYRAAEWADDLPPLRVQVQVAHQMLAAGADLGFTAACIGGNKLVWQRIERNEKFEATLIQVLTDFWRCVETRTPPPVDGSIATAKALAALYPKDDGGTAVLPAEAAEWDKLLTDAKEQIKELEAIKVAAENKLKAAIGDNSFGEVGGECRYSWKWQERSEHIVKASSFRVLRRIK
jgi:putative phage-type endonuclease